jgi:hypothetical protein
MLEQGAQWTDCLPNQLQAQGSAFLATAVTMATEAAAATPAVQAAAVTTGHSYPTQAITCPRAEHRPQPSHI